MARADKAAAVAELTTAFRESSAAVLTEYRGLTVAELKELRRSLAGNATYVVVKNTLSKIAAREAGVDVEALLQGPSAIAFVTGDPVTVAKSLRAFGREHPLLVVKGGVLDGAPLSVDDIRKLADLESREVLLAKLAGGFIAPATQLASVLMAPVRQLAQVLGALAAQVAADPSRAGSDGASATDPQPEAVAEAESTAAEPTPEAAPVAEAEADAPAAEEAATEPVAADEAVDETPAEAPAEATTEDTQTDGVADASSD
jgi:large subunit ribosomal protein L10